MLSRKYIIYSYFVSEENNEEIKNQYQVTEMCGKDGKKDQSGSS